jgi:hypothetical protein
VIAVRAGFLRLVCAGAHPVAGNLASAHRPKPGSERGTKAAVNHTTKTRCIGLFL